MSLTPPKRDLNRCCSRCTGRPHLDRCRNVACQCHLGHVKERLAPVIPIHRCESESCADCLTCRYCGQSMSLAPGQTKAMSIIAHTACRKASR